MFHFPTSIKWLVAIDYSLFLSSLVGINRKNIYTVKIILFLSIVNVVGVINI